jgi:hypothetical protein
VKHEGEAARGAVCGTMATCGASWGTGAACGVSWVPVLRVARHEVPKYLQ